jgi:hypothetical protein
LDVASNILPSGALMRMEFSVCTFICVHESHAKESVTADSGVVHARLRGHGAQLGNGEGAFTGSRGVETRDGIGDNRARHELAQTDCDPIPPQIVDDIANSRNIVDASQDCNHIRVPRSGAA